MKIRITGKGLPKAQWLIGQPGVSFNPAVINQQPNYNWMTTEQMQFPPVGQGALQTAMKNAAAYKQIGLKFKPKTNVPTVQPTAANTGIVPSPSITDSQDDGYGNIIPQQPAKFNVTDYSKLPSQCPSGQTFNDVLQKCVTPEEQAQMDKAIQGFKDWRSGKAPNPMKSTGNEGTDSNPMGRGPVETSPQPSGFKLPSKEQINNTLGKVNNFFDGLERTVPWLLAGTELINSGKRKRAFDKFMRKRTSADYLFPEGIGSRGDYVASGDRFGEFRPDEYVVNKGMYTSQFYPTMAQFGGGVIPDALTMPTTPFEVTPAMMFPSESAPEKAESTESSSYKSAGANPEAEETWSDISSQYPGVQNYGIWGDKEHRKRKSDHNTGDALDIGIKDESQGTEIAQKLIKEAQDRNIKYIIWNRQIWNPSVSNDWRPYSGESPHTDHIHVSFNRNPESLGQISMTHNNPLNIHHGSFAEAYGGKQGAKDGDGYVSMFPDFNVGIQAAKDLLFGPNYNSLTITQARNKWVNGDINDPSTSSNHILKEMGQDKKLSDLTTAEREKLLKLFARWEGKQAYNKIKGMNLYEQGGSYNENDVYELTEDEIKQILAAGGNVEFI